MQQCIDHHAAFAGNACGLCQRDVGAQADGAKHQVGCHHFAIAQGGCQAGGAVVQGLHRGAKVPDHAQRLQGRAHLFARACGQQGRERPLGRVHHVHRVAALQQVVGKFAADQARAHDEHGFGRLAQLLLKARQVAQVVDGLRKRCRVTLQGHVNGVRASGQHQMAVGQGLRGAVGGAERQGLGLGGNALHLRMGQERHVQGFGHFGGRRGDELVGAALLGAGVGQRGLGVKVAAVGGDQHDGRVSVEFAEFACRRPARQSGADDDQRRGAGARLGDGDSAHSDHHDFKVGLGHAAVWARPALGHVGPQGASGNAVFGAASGLVVHKATHDADIGFHGFFFKNGNRVGVYLAATVARMAW